MSRNIDSSELCLIDSGIQSLRTVPLKRDLTSLNLHCNFIEKIENLHQLRNLKYLDLSSNQIKKIEGLQNLMVLQTLNLSCNNIQYVEGLESLLNLKKINLSYNQIVDVSGFVLMNGVSFKLNSIELHGNNIESIQGVVSSLSGLSNLRRLSLSQDGASNPVCYQPDYSNKILTLSQITVLDGIDRQGDVAHHDNVLSDIPGLDEYMEYLMSSTSTSDVDPINLSTPHIDQVLQRFHKKAADIEGSDNEEELKQKNDRIDRLENQLKELMKDKESKKATPKSFREERRRQIPCRDTDITESEEDLQKSRKGKKSCPKSRSRSNSGTRKTSSERKGKSLNVKGEKISTSGDKVADDKNRREMEDTYKSLMDQLSNERDQRWKAEQVTRKLIDHVNVLKEKAEDEKERYKGISQINEELAKRDEHVSALDNENTDLKESLLEMQHELDDGKKLQNDLKQALRKLERNSTEMEANNIQKGTHEAKQTHDAQMKAAALGRENDLIKNEITNLKNQLHQLQELLAIREQEHRNELSKRYTLESRELQDIIQREVNKSDKFSKQELSVSEKKIEALTKQYAELEDEFRLALRIETDRFEQLQSAYEELSRTSSNNHQALIAAQRKDEKSSNMVADLTSLVKEQKIRIAELSKSKQEQVSDLKERIQTQEAHLDEARRRMVQLELMRQDRARLQAQADAQNSIIEGLRSERKLWGEELAQQGSALAQDRGRLEAKIDSQNSEISFLKKQIDRETDSLKIKSKMLDDQTDTIKKFKDALVEREQEIKDARDEAINTQKTLEEQLTEERNAYQEAQVKNESLIERKEELKVKISELEEELDEVNGNNKAINNKWKEKSSLIGTLEEQVLKMKETWENKEKKLTDERDKALTAATAAIGKMRTIDDTFRAQLDSKEQAHREEILRLVDTKQEEIDASERRVDEVENEMRLLLKENEENKKQMEGRLKRVGKAFTELQQGIGF